MMSLQRLLLSLSVMLGTSLVSVPAGHSTIFLAQAIPELSQSVDELSRQAAEYRQQNYRRLEAYTLGRLAKKLAQEGQVDLAIVFYKRALNLVEDVRADLRRVEALQERLSLEPVALQESLVQTFSEDIYRPLAALLLSQDRVWEAQQVLDLLKVQELDEFLDNVEVPPQGTTSGNSRFADRFGQASSGSAVATGTPPTGTGTTGSGNSRFADRFGHRTETEPGEGNENSDTASTRFARATPATDPRPPSPDSGIEIWDAEIILGAEYDRLTTQAIADGQELLALRAIPPANRSPAQSDRLADLVTQEQRLNQQFTTFIRSGEVRTLLEDLNQSARSATLNPEALNSLRDNLKRLDRAAILYPLILDDRIELVLTTAESPPIHRSVPVSKTQFQSVLRQFRQTLVDPNQRDPRPFAAQLYEWLIKPLEPELAQADTQTLIYAPDGWLRYVPLAALYDGEQWLTERYRINYITAQSLTDLNRAPQTNVRLLAAGYTDGEYRVRTRQQEFTFSGLPYAELELQSLAEIIPQTQLVRNQDFAPARLVPQLDDFTIVHFATHATFVSDTPQDSFIVFGNGEIVTLRDLENWSLPNVDLVVLSACQTALGGKLGNGQEILGLGYQIQRTGARAAIASLWAVDDGGTQRLMTNFYRVLTSRNDMTKAEALREAQIQMIRGNRPTPIALDSEQENVNFSHPYYWAPFIVIGNGL
ncbi:MAG: CHAT domain-containing protein [Prochlorotrichaceae cyanobacterium]|jgi:CHAT domain-containing protein